MAELVVVRGAHRGAAARLEQGSLVIGRSERVGLSLRDDSKVSNKHARVVCLGGERFLLEDLGSTNGSFVNDERVEQIPLRSGDLIKIGRSLIVFRAEGPSVRLEDLATSDGRSTGAIARREGSAAEQASSTSAPDLPPGRAAAPDAALRAALQELVLAAGEVSLVHGLDRTLEAVAGASGAQRALLLLRHPHTGGLGCAAARGAQAGGPVEADLIRQALGSGQVVVGAAAAAAPVRIQGLNAGALYLDGFAEPPRALEALGAAALLAGLQVGLDRSRRLASAASEIVGLAQAQPTRRRLDLSAYVQAAERLYAEAARARGLQVQVVAAPGVVVLADPALLSRGLDRLLEHVLAEARGGLSVDLGVLGPEQVRLVVTARAARRPEDLAALLDPDGVAADLRRAWDAFGDGLLAVARAALQRAGARLTVAPQGDGLTFTVDLERAPPVAAGGSL